jgi:hypothetical protein
VFATEKYFLWGTKWILEHYLDKFRLQGVELHRILHNWQISMNTSCKSNSWLHSMSCYLISQRVLKCYRVRWSVCYMQHAPYYLNDINKTPYIRAILIFALFESFQGWFYLMVQINFYALLLSLLTDTWYTKQTNAVELHILTFRF